MIFKVHFFIHTTQYIVIAYLKYLLFKIYYEFLGVGIYGINLPAKSLKFCDCNITFPGPTSFVKNNPSPPKKIFPNPFTVSIS